MNTLEKEVVNYDHEAREERAVQLADDLLQLIERQTEQILNAQEALDSFSYSVSHDFRAPLRAIHGFSKALHKRLAGKLDAEEERYFQIVIDNATKMGRLIDDLLKLHRIGRWAVKAEVLDARALIKDVFGQLKVKEQNADKIVLELRPLGEMKADRKMIREVYHQLLDNAIKFSALQERILIEAGERQEGNERVFYVRDFGVGFDIAYADKVFAAFQRLHPEEEFEGTGVGLAIVQRIIQMHRGRVWVEAAPESGTTVFFTVPN